MQIWMWLPPVLSITFVFGMALAGVLTRKETTKQLTSTVAPQRYGKSDSIMSEAERSIYPLIQWAVGKEMQVFPKVNLGSVITVPQNVERRFVHVRQVSQHQIDFALCVVGRASVVIAIQVSDPNDEDSGRYETDQFTQDALDAAHIPVLWLNPRKSYMAHELKQLIHAALHGPVVTNADDDVEETGKL